MERWQPAQKTIFILDRMSVNKKEDESKEVDEKNLCQMKQVWDEKMNEKSWVNSWIQMDCTKVAVTFVC